MRRLPRSSGQSLTSLVKEDPLLRGCSAFTREVHWWQTTQLSSKFSLPGVAEMSQCWGCSSVMVSVRKYSLNAPVRTGHQARSASPCQGSSLPHSIMTSRAIPQGRPPTGHTRGTPLPVPVNPGIPYGDGDFPSLGRGTTASADEGALSLLWRRGPLLAVPRHPLLIASFFVDKKGG